MGKLTKKIKFGQIDSKSVVKDERLIQEWDFYALGMGHYTMSHIEQINNLIKATHVEDHFYVMNPETHQITVRAGRIIPDSKFPTKAEKVPVAHINTLVYIHSFQVTSNTGYSAKPIVFKIRKNSVAAFNILVEVVSAIETDIIDKEHNIIRHIDELKAELKKETALKLNQKKAELEAEKQKYITKREQLDKEYYNFKENLKKEVEAEKKALENLKQKYTCSIEQEVDRILKQTSLAKLTRRKFNKAEYWEDL